MCSLKIKLHNSSKNNYFIKFQKYFYNKFINNNLKKLNYVIKTNYIIDYFKY